MTKRKQDVAVSASHDNSHTSKRPRTNKSPPNRAGIDAPFKTQSVASPVEGEIREEYKEAKEDKEARKFAKKLARRHRRELDAQVGKTEHKKKKAHQGEVAPAEKSGIAVSNKPKKQRKDGERKSSHDKHGSAQKAEGTASWRVSEPIGGRMLDLDPLFSLDERWVK